MAGANRVGIGIDNPSDRVVGAEEELAVEAAARKDESPLPGMTRREVAVGYAWNLAFGLVSRAVFPLLQLFFYRRLGPAEIGIYALLLPVFQITESLRDAGLAVTYIADREATGKREGAYATLAIISASFFALVIFFIRGYVAQALGVPQIEWGMRMVALAVFLNGFCTIPVNKLQKKARFRDAGLADFAATFFSFVLALFLVIKGFGFAALVWQFFFKSLIYTVICWILEPTVLGAPQREVLRAIWKHSASNMFNNLLFTVYTVADTIMITKVATAVAHLPTFKARVDAGKIAGGNYNTAYTYASKPLEFFTFPLARTLLVAYSRSNDDLRALSGMFARTITVSLIGLLPVYFLIGLFAKPLVLFFLSAKYVDAIPLLTMLAIYAGARSIGTLSGNVLVAIKKQGYNMLGWIGAYVTVAGIMILNRDQLSVRITVEALTSGAVVVYVVNVVSAFAILKPNRESWARLERGLGTAALTSGLVVIAANLPFPAWINLLIALIALPPFHLALVGKALAGSHTACFSKTGIKRLWTEI